MGFVPQRGGEIPQWNNLGVVNAATSCIRYLELRSRALGRHSSPLSGLLGQVLNFEVGAESVKQSCWNQRGKSRSRVTKLCDFAHISLVDRRISCVHNLHFQWLA